MVQDSMVLGGRYRVGPQIGRGGMGSVYLADDLRLRKRVVVKVLDSALASNPRVAERFLNEARIQARLDHPNIVRATDALESDGHLAIVVDFVEGVDLDQHLRSRGGRLPLVEAVAILRQVCAAVGCAHGHGIVHRDLKPGNVMVSGSDPAWTAHVMDFGIAKILGDSDMQRTRAGSVLGTPAYMSPEQVRGDVELDARADIYSLGALLYQLVTGALPFDGATDYSVSHQILSGHTPAAPSTLVPGLPAPVDRLVSRAMAHDRDGRHQSAAELDGDLASLDCSAGPLRTIPGGRATASAPPPTVLAEAEPAPVSTAALPPAVSRSGAPAAATLLLLVLVAALGAGLFYTLRAQGLSAVNPAAIPMQATTPPTPDSPGTPPEPVAEPEPELIPHAPVEPLPDWYCICYQELIHGVPTRSTTCRRTSEECEDLRLAADAGVRAFVANSVTVGCTALRGAYPWSQLGSAHLWKPSARPGAYWSDRGCLLP